MPLNYTAYTLDEVTIEEVSAYVQDYLSKQGVERRNIQRLRLTVEEMLLNVMHGCGKGIQVSIGIGKQFGRHVFNLRYNGEPFDPTQSDENTQGNEIMAALGYSPAWGYRGRTNTASLVLKERANRSTLFKILIAVIAAACLGILSGAIPEALRQEINEVLLTPVVNAFLGMMGTFAGLMIAFTICSGILGVGDSMTLGKLGKRIILRYVGVSFAVCTATVVLVIPFLRLNHSALNLGEGSQISQISKMIFDILPSNPVSPFQAGNTLQIIVIAIFIGVGLLSIGERGSRVRALVIEGTALTQHIVAFICGFVPLLVFVMLLRQIWAGEIQVFLGIWKPLVMIFVTEVILAAVLWMATAIRLKCSPMMLLKKILPPFIIAFTTASSMSAMTLSMETCKKKLGVENTTASLMYPLGTVVYMPASIISFAAIACSFAEIYQVGINPGWFIMAVITVTLLVIAMPPIPGAGLMVYTILFARLGIPADALILAAAIDVIVDFCNTGFNVLLLILQIAGEAGSMGRLDRGILMDDDR